MKFQNLFKATVTVVLMFGTASHAMAEMITLKATGLPTDGYLSAGQYNGSFNGSGSFPKAYTVDALNFGFVFNDDGNDPFGTIEGIRSSNEVLTVTTESGGKRVATLTTTYLVPVTKTGEGESVSLNFGAVSFQGQTKAGDKTSDPSGLEEKKQGADIWVQGTGTNARVCTEAEANEKNSSCKKATYYTVKKTVVTTDTTDYTGMITFGGPLLTSLFQNDKLDFSLLVTGDLLLTSANLDVTFTPNIIVPPANVPEPGSLALFGIAMLGVFGASRKRRA